MADTPALPIDFSELTREQLERALADLGIERYRAGQLFQWIYRRGVVDFEEMTNLSREMRGRLAAHFRVSTPEIGRRDVSEDGTEKFLLRLADGRHIEAVYIPDTPAHTLCISTQVGCAMGCLFCLTAKMGLTRHLTPGEIVGQVRVLSGAVDLRNRRFNIVLMGMGEPLHNYDNTMAALRILADPDGFALSPRRVTLSTVGLVPAMERLAAEAFMPNLAVSLHGTTEEQRSALVPLNRKYGLQQILDTCRRFPLKRRNRITFEYVLLAGVNDTLADARRLAKLLHGIKSKINLIPLNPAAGITYERPADDAVDRFGRILAEHHLTVSIRKSRGRDIRAACGQLVVEGTRPSPGQQLAEKI